MHIPSQKQWQTIIDKLYSVLPLALDYEANTGERALNMLECDVNDDRHECGTVHCVGGWYAIAHYKERVYKKQVVVNFFHGADLLAGALGFDSAFQDGYTMQQWIHKHQTLWGNCGPSIFSNPAAYDHGNGPAKDLADVIEHFEFVKENCRKHEATKECIA